MRNKKCVYRTAGGSGRIQGPEAKDKLETDYMGFELHPMGIRDYLRLVRKEVKVQNRSDKKLLQ